MKITCTYFKIESKKKEEEDNSSDDYDRFNRQTNKKVNTKTIKK